MKRALQQSGRNLLLSSHLDTLLPLVKSSAISYSPRKLFTATLQRNFHTSFSTPWKKSTSTLNTTDHNKMMVPAAPYAYMSSQMFLDLSQLDQMLSEVNERRQEAYDLGSKLKAALIVCRASTEQNSLSKEQLQENEKKLETLVVEALNSNATDNLGKETNRLGNLGFIFSDYIRYLVYQEFLQSGKLLSPSKLKERGFTDEEYLSGVLSFVNNDVKRYVVGRATVRDAKSVILARNLVSKLLDHLMKYDFRNGNLRRKYDGVKYALKTCETILYELSVTGCQDAIEEEEEGGKKKEENSKEPDSKRPKIEFDQQEDDILPSVELESLRERMAKRDELREQLIKKCRDGQKAAKQAIYALHREDFKGASRLIRDCENCVTKDLQPIVQDEPQLRYGSFTNVLEEYAEAKLYHAWLLGNGENDEKTESKVERKGNPDGTILLHTDFTVIPLEPQEYLGGLCDLTGEIGRFAVKRATIRDLKNVQLCMETNMSVLFAMDSISKLPGNLGKKLDPLRRTVEKQERMLYELSLVQATGRNTTVAETVVEDNSNF